RCLWVSQRQRRPHGGDRPPCWGLVRLLLLQAALAAVAVVVASAIPPPATYAPALARLSRGTPTAGPGNGATGCGFRRSARSKAGRRSRKGRPFRAEQPHRERTAGFVACQ